MHILMSMGGRYPLGHGNMAEALGNRTPGVLLRDDMERRPPPAHRRPVCEARLLVLLLSSLRPILLPLALAALSVWGCWCWRAGRGLGLLCLGSPGRLLLLCLGLELRRRQLWCFGRGRSWGRGRCRSRGWLVSCWRGQGRYWSDGALCRHSDRSIGSLWGGPVFALDFKEGFLIFLMLNFGGFCWRSSLGCCAQKSSTALCRNWVSMVNQVHSATGATGTSETYGG